MKNHIKFVLVLSGMLLSGCEEFVAIGPPKNQLITASVFNDDAHANAAVTGIYSEMYDAGLTYNISFRTGIAADELTNYSTNGPTVLLYQNNPQPLDAPTNSFWDNGYNFIYQANAIWEGCTRANELNKEVKKQLLGEAAFIRAFWYFYLVNFYGDVPILTTTDHIANSKAERKPKSEVYQQIVKDLEYASSNLNPAYVDAGGINAIAQRLRPNQYAAIALLARVHLYMGNWEKAGECASSVIAQNMFYDTVSIDRTFLKNNKAAIWQLPQPSGNNLSTLEGQWFILTGRPSGSSATSNCSTISPSLISAFEEGDFRKANWVSSFTDVSVNPAVTYYFPYKYKENETTNPSEYSTVLRLAEQYLIRAEARARLGNIEGALADLNLIRGRAGLDPLTISSTEGFIEALLKERRIELFAEWGHRWLDIKRLGRIDEVMTDITPLKGGTDWISEKQLWPIPRFELENNPNLTQNPSYN